MLTWEKTNVLAIPYIPKSKVKCILCGGDLSFKHTTVTNSGEISLFFKCVNCCLVHRFVFTDVDYARQLLRTRSSVTVKFIDVIRSDLPYPTLYT